MEPPPPCCGVCAARFTLASRAHACHRCAAAVCGACASKSFPLPADVGGRGGEPDSDDDDAPARGAGSSKPGASGARRAAGGMYTDRTGRGWRRSGWWAGCVTLCVTLCGSCEEGG